ncbi:MAG: hypothetical protein HUU20_19100 [Pirellulales bacterium]|nr:hypothetical protein [Pirellulales bacterium]
MRLPIRPLLFSILLAALIAAIPSGRCLAQSVALELPRHAYCRGESIPLSVSLSEPAQNATLQVAVDGVQLLSQPISGASAKVLVPTANLKVGPCTLKASLRTAAGELSATSDVTIARRPPSDRLEIWLWGGGYDSDFYFDHGFTIAGGPVWVYWQDNGRAAAVKSLDARLARGVYATIWPCGGISRRDLKGVDPQAPDVAYRGAGRQEEEFFNPFSPVVEKVRRESNDRFLGALGDHPAIKVAFYNTELVDDLWLDNLNQEGIELTRRKLGFTRDQRGSVKFVAPGVIADDDRGYRFQKYVYQEGNGLAYANRKTAEDIKRLRSDVWTFTDPYRIVTYLDMFPGLDLVGTWTYTNNDPKLMFYIESMRALTRGTQQRPLQTVTLLNYPGMLAPKSITGESAASQWLAKNPSHAGWLLMGPDRCKEVSWIILSRAPKLIGYYYSSACDPEKYNQPEDQFRVPHATSDAIKELSDRVYGPYGPMITRLDPAPRRIAVLSSQASRLYGKSPATIGYPNEQIYGFYSVMAMAHLDGDVLFDEHVERGDLKGYDVLAMPRCDAVTKKMHDEILALVKRGGTVISDQYLGPEIPGTVRFDFDFTYRPKVNADAIAGGVMYAEWDDHLNPQTAKLKEARGVTAEEDQKIMESYARQLKSALAGKVEPEIEIDTPKALVNVLEKGGVKYLVLVNDHRAYGDRVGKYKAILDKLVPQTVTVTVRHSDRPAHVYDLLQRKLLPTTGQGGSYSFPVELSELGGTLIALSPAKFSRIETRMPETAKRGEQTAISVAILDDAGKPLAGLQPLKLSMVDSKGNPTETTGYYCAENGELQLPVHPALNDEPGKWTVRVEDLTAGMTAENVMEVR